MIRNSMNRRYDTDLFDILLKGECGAYDEKVTSKPFAFSKPM
jgi:hypothetical protein